MKNYHVVTFDHARAARTMFDDLLTLEVEGVDFLLTDRSPSTDGAQVWVRVPEDTDLDAHRDAVKNFSLGRGSHVVTRESRKG